MAIFVVSRCCTAFIPRFCPRDSCRNICKATHPPQGLRHRCHFDGHLSQAPSGCPRWPSSGFPHQEGGHSCSGRDSGLLALGVAVAEGTCANYYGLKKMLCRFLSGPSPDGAALLPVTEYRAPKHSGSYIVPRISRLGGMHHG